MLGLSCLWSAGGGGERKGEGRGWSPTAKALNLQLLSCCCPCHTFHTLQ